MQLYETPTNTPGVEEKFRKKGSTAQGFIKMKRQKLLVAWLNGSACAGSVEYKGKSGIRDLHGICLLPCGWSTGHRP